MNLLRCASLLVLASGALAASAQNLVSNGDFSQGNVGFTTDLAYKAPQTDALASESVYTLATNTRNPYNLCTLGDGIVDYSDHTDGNGKFMVVNGATTFNSLVWAQTLTGLTVGRTYRFDGWVSRWTPTTNYPSAKLIVLAGSTFVTAFEDPRGAAGTWVAQTGTFTATATSLSLQIRDLESAAVGNDFGLDDLSVQAVPEPASLCALGVGAVALVCRRRAARVVKNLD